MKRLIILAALCVTTGFASAQHIETRPPATYFSFYGGAGFATNYTFDAGISGGVRFAKQGKSRTAFGAQLFYQGITFQYDKEEYAQHGGMSIGGMTIRNKTGYICVAPGISQFFGPKDGLEAYLNVGAGFKMSGTETMRKWDNTHGFTNDNYDSTLDTSPNINSMIIRFGFGLNEHLYLGEHWRLTISEDFGFTPSSYTKTSDVNYGSRTRYSPAHKLNPGFLSLQIAITHVSVKPKY